MERRALIVWPSAMGKRDVLNVLSENFAWDATAPAGTLELVQENGETVECALVLMSEWQTKLPGYLK